MNKCNSVLGAFALLIFSVTSYINEKFGISIISMVLSLIVLSICLYQNSVRIKPICLIFFISECILMLFDENMPAYFHIALMLFGSASYSILEKVNSRSAFLCSLVGITSIMLLVFILAFLTLFCHIVFGFSATNILSYVPFVISLIICWAVPFSKQIIALKN